MLLPAPHIKVAGLVGAVARASLLPAGLAPSAASPQPARSGSEGAGEESWLRRSGSGMTAASRELVQSSISWLQTNITQARQDMMLRPFATAAAEVQLGWFQKNMFDFTRLVAKLDVGLPAPRQLQPGEATVLALRMKGYL